jgi:aspartokinase-like uncharacterized kinase
MPDLVIKIGGGLLTAVADLDGAIRGVESLSRSCRVLVVPGGGPFADAVRDVDRRVELSDDAAHWMAVLAMDQYAHLLASRRAALTVVWSLAEAVVVREAGQVPVLAPFRWLREEDPLPHSWDVTSDSIAAWIAGAAGARALLLVKPRGATGSLVDGYFDRACSRRLATTVVPVEQMDEAVNAIVSQMRAVI